MNPAERRAQWEAKRLLAAVENALGKAERGRWEDAITALVRVEGIATTAKMAAIQARREAVINGE